MSYLDDLRKKIQIISNLTPSSEFLDNYYPGGFTKKQVKKIAEIVPSDKIMDSKAAHKAIEDGQIEGLK